VEMGFFLGGLSQYPSSVFLGAKESMVVLIRFFVLSVPCVGSSRSALCREKECMLYVLLSETGDIREVEIW
jgi:hypothetical protein